MDEGVICCQYPEETAQAMLTVLTVTPDNHLIPAQEELGRLLKAFTMLQEKGMGTPEHALKFLMEY